MTYPNYSIGEILEKKNKGVNAPKLVLLYEEVEKYRKTMERRVADCLQTMSAMKPDHKMRWIQENVPSDIQQYVRLAALGKEVNVLMRSEKKWKTVADIGLKVSEPESTREHIEEWFSHWDKQAQLLSALDVQVYESHAHYNLKPFKAVRERLLPMIHSAGVKQIIIPAVEYATNHQMVRLFDTPEYDYIRYAFGSHPKYVWKENWTSQKWDEFRTLLEHPKCVAIGETGLDYSYSELCEKHRATQLEMFTLLIEEANRHDLPLILHIRSAKEDALCEFDAKEDAMEMLSTKKLHTGAVLHCFGGTASDVSKYMELGISAFGIGGKITYGITELESAVATMPESAIVLETDAPYIKVDGERSPNTSLSLLEIAGKVAQLRGTTTEHILAVSYENADRLFRK